MQGGIGREWLTDGGDGRGDDDDWDNILTNIYANLNKPGGSE